MPSEREKLECLCSICFNTRKLFEALVRYSSSKQLKTFTSITQYFINEKKCVQARNGCVSKKCINGECDKCNGIIGLYQYKIPKKELPISFYQFELITSTEANSKGKYTKRQGRKSYKEHQSVCKQMLDDASKKYLLHRYDYVQDKFFWPLIEEACLCMGDIIAHIDYSENLKEKPKFETQSSLFWVSTQSPLLCHSRHI